MKDGEEQRYLEESQANQIEISFSSEMQELSPLIQALNCSVNGGGSHREHSLWSFGVSGKGKQRSFKTVSPPPTSSAGMFFPSSYSTVSAWTWSPAKGKDAGFVKNRTINLKLSRRSRISMGRFHMAPLLAIVRLCAASWFFQPVLAVDIFK